MTGTLKREIGNLGGTCRALLTLSRRHLALFLRDRATVFFSLLAPIIILVLYLLFLKDVQVSSMRAFLPDASEKAIQALADSWLIAGTVSVTCLTVALNSMGVMVRDRELGIDRDFLASPVRPSLVTLSYFFAFLAVTVFISLLVYALGLVYLLATGSLAMAGAEVLEGVGILLLSCLSSTMIMLLILRFFRTSNAVGAFSGIFSAAIGFVIGAYMPTSIFPAGVQYVTNLVPGSYSAGLFRNVFMRGALENAAAGLSPDAVQGLIDTYSLKLNFFGAEVGMGWMYGILAFSVLLFLAVNLLVGKTRKSK